MAVEACRHLMGGDGFDPKALFFATTAPPYLDKTNAAVIHAACGMKPGVGAYDMIGSMRSGVSALCTAEAGGGIAVLSDLRSGLPGGEDEANGGDGAAAFHFADHGPEIAVLTHHVSRTGEFLDRWRTPGADHSRIWEERFAESIYDNFAREVFADVLAQADVAATGIDQLIVTGTHARALKRVQATLAAAGAKLSPDLGGVIGHAGAAHPGLALAAALDAARPGDTILLLVLADGADALLFRVGKDIEAARPAKPLNAQIAEGEDGLSYARFLSWRGQLTREPPRRPDPDSPSGPPAMRLADWKFGLTGSRCEACGTVQMPPQRVCVGCHAVDTMTPIPMANRPARIANFTIDHLSFSLSPPALPAVLDFDGGGRMQTELADVLNPAEIALGAPVEMTFRRFHTGPNGVHNYFWKARVAKAPQQARN